MTGWGRLSQAAAFVKASPRGSLPPSSRADVNASPSPAAPPIKVCVFTWNIGNARPSKLELSAAIEAEGGGFDLVVVGVQESRYDVRSEADIAVALRASKMRSRSRFLPSIVRGSSRLTTASKHPTSTSESVTQPSSTRCTAVDEEDDDEGAATATAAPVSPPAGSRRSSELPDHSYRGAFPGRRRSTLARMYAVWVKHWRGLISEHLGSDWDVVAHEILWEMQLTVYAR